MVEHLTSALKAVLEKKDDLNAALESATPTREDRDKKSGNNRLLFIIIGPRSPGGRIAIELFSIVWHVATNC